MRYVLIQARRPDDPMRTHELECFARGLGLHVHELEVFNLLEGPEHRLDQMMKERQIAFFIGGSGDYSVSTGGPDPLVNFARYGAARLADSGLPVFGSCWGYHALVAALGGQVAKTGIQELGTYRLRVVRDAGDPLFEHTPDEFDAQMGHKDWVLQLPDIAVPLVENDASPHQAVRFGDTSVYGLQFHAELEGEDNRARFMHYLENYGGEESIDAYRDRFGPSPHATAILGRFRELFGAQHEGRASHDEDAPSEDDEA